MLKHIVIIDIIIDSEKAGSWRSDAETTSEDIVETYNEANKKASKAIVGQ